MAECTAATQAFIDYYEAQRVGNTNCNLDNQKIDTRAEYCNTCIPQYDALLSKAASVCGDQFDASISHNYDYVKLAKYFFCSTDSNTGEYCDIVYQKGFNYQIPYSEWDSSLCSSSCVAQIDQGIRDIASNANLLGTYNINTSLFSGSNNPVSACPGITVTSAGGAAGTSGAATGATGDASAAAGATGATGVNGVNGVTGANGVSNNGATTGTTTGTNGLTGGNKITPLKNNTTSGANTLSAQVCLLSLIICLIMAYLK